MSFDDVKSAVQVMRTKSGSSSGGSGGGDGGASGVTSRSTEGNYDSLLKYGIDFTTSAEEGKLDPVIGRDDEICRAIQILSRRTKNNPVLIGDPGVGEWGPWARNGVIAVHEFCPVAVDPLITNHGHSQ